ncbi:MAG: isochorismatase family protein [Lentimicrobiaceae bacterium]|nr:isochorismatase family protein [Lentimicrobiaceae bacterium]
MKALLIVDLQNDFCPGGALPAPDADRIVPVINGLMDKFDLVLASKDWHPATTVHFEKWPAHCVRETPGAEFHPGLDAAKVQKVFFKGTDDKDDGYSAFEATNGNLADYLRKKEVDEVYVTGLVTEYCVKQTVLESLRQGFKTFVIEDAVQGISAHPNDVPLAKAEMEKAGALIIKAAKIKTAS